MNSLPPSRRPSLVPSASSRSFHRRVSALSLSAAEQGDTSRVNPEDQVVADEIDEIKRYEDFTTIDWVRDAAREQQRRKAKRQERAGFFERDGRLGWRRRLWEAYDAGQAWLVVTLIGTAIGLNAAFLNIVTEWLSDIKLGHFTLKTIFAFTSARLVKSYAPYAAGSGISEIKCIIAGFVMKGFLGFWTLLIKSIGLPLAIASGLSVGKEGPSVHYAVCTGNVISRFFDKYRRNAAKTREILSACAAAGVAVAFGSPIGGVLFSLEAMNPFRTGQLVMFTVSYDRQWHFFEIFFYIILGIFGGLYGALVIKWNLRMQAFRKRYLAQYPILEATILATATAILCYPNKFLRIDMTESMEILFLECEGGHDYDGLCDRQNRWTSVMSLLIATVLRTFLVIISYGCKVPAGIFVPSMAIGASFGRMVGILVQAMQQAFPNSAFFSACQPDLPCITPGTYAFLGAAAALSGIMHITVSVVVIMFELTGALTYILPTMIVVGVTKAVSDRFGKGGIADRMIWFNGMPFLDNKEDHAFGVPVSTAMTSELKALPISGLEVRDIEKLLDDNKFSGYPIVEDATSMMLVGYAGRTELRYALDRARRDQMATPRTKCFFTPVAGQVPITPSTPNPAVHFDYLIHPRLPLETVMELFKKLGPRVILVEYRGRLTGLITVKDCLKYQFQAEAHENPKDDSALREAQDRLWQVIRKTAGWINSRLSFLKRQTRHNRLATMADNQDVEMTGRSPSPSRGMKRTADEAFNRAPPPIRALHQDVVNKIAAGEIIVSPWNALKELIENAVDAGATMLEILVKDGGLKLLQISDNGHGINKADLPLLCQRHTTSKIKEFEDLTSIGTYGFRGEALASISHIAHLTVTTKTMDSSCAWKAYYTNENLTPLKPGQPADPKPCAGKQGTQITVEDLFYNVPTRRRAFRSSSEEYAKILDIIGKYSIHCKGVAFSCKKHGEAGTSLNVQSHLTTVDRIRTVFNSAVANDLISFEAANERWGFKSDGLISSANYSAKKSTFLLFINHRSVESTAIRKAIDQTYATFLPKGGKPFVYLSLDIDPARVDVNVHPTKREVGFLNEEEIIEVICDEIRTRLGSVDTSRTFMTQSLLGPKKTTTPMTPSAPGQSEMLSFSTPLLQHEDSTGSTKSTTPRTAAKPYENNLVRVDSRVRKITSMLPPTLSSSPSKGSRAEGQGTEETEYEFVEKQQTTIRLTSIKELRATVRDEINNTLSDMFSNHTFVGIVDTAKRIAAVQSGVKLYLIDYGMVCTELFYQLGLSDFSNFGTIKFKEPLSVADLLRIGAEYEQSRTPIRDQELDWNEVVQVTLDQLVQSRGMLNEYFALDISEDGELHSIPLILKRYMPCLAKLPTFLLRLGPHVNWDEEKDCFDSFLRELASFYSPESLPSTSTTSELSQEAQEEANRRRKQLERSVEIAVFPAFSKRLVATKGLRKAVVEVADLKGLYRVFERC
ncbi:CLC voltage-gated chloride channel [Aureobasidium subglaciale]|nr:CLC voltage-gated chloride channel [Aureobasidium subglaciale]KAI5219735.1 CLC voltage-gated chloride channel [Aureobasidium subglaciale]KAI5223426.1 CLC voltage-gated chloride channel [Aureobasidium subglaciale]KAI5260395.1 CLC voltage-gated chloride channel [Aureobasidium subglaciale]